VLDLPILSALIPGGVNYGKLLLVEFEPHSVWYEASLTIAGQALESGVRTEYHTFRHTPKEVRDILMRSGVDIDRFEDSGAFRVIDSYTAQTGLSEPETTGNDWYAMISKTLKVSDWSITTAQRIRKGIPKEEKRWLHIDDNTSVLNRYNSENAIIDYWRTRGIPETRAEEAVVLHSLLTGVASDVFYRQFESLCDGIIDFRSEERGDQIEHLVRVRLVRGRTCDSRWRRLRVLEDSRVAFADKP
jgi:KaiC/GvpD/RAD55 family RecA-like ATPase